MWTAAGGRVNCRPSLQSKSAFYPCVGIGKALYSERLMPRNDGGTLTGKDVICIPCINDTNHDTLIHEQCEVQGRSQKTRFMPVIADGIVAITVLSYGGP